MKRLPGRQVHDPADGYGEAGCLPDHPLHAAWAQIFSPWYAVKRLEHFAWPGEAKETRRLFWLRKRGD